MRFFSKSGTLIGGIMLIFLGACAAQKKPMGPPRPYQFSSNIVYLGNQTNGLKLDIYQSADVDSAEPVLFYLPAKGKKEKGAEATDHSYFNGMLSLSDKFPCPVVDYLAYHYAVVSLEYANQDLKLKDLQAAIRFLKTQTNFKLDLSRVASLEKSKDGYLIRFLRNPESKSVISLKLPSAEDHNFSRFLSTATIKKVMGYLKEGIKGPAFDPAVQPIAMPCPDVSWVDPIVNVPDKATYYLYPTPSRGKGTLGSFMVYLPRNYASSHKKYPVLYYLHGGNGNQREGRWLINVMDEAMRQSIMPDAIIVCVQALPIGWYCNANVAAPGVQSGPVEDVLIHDLIPFVDKTFRTITAPEARGLEGWSMGGFGATRLAFKYPNLFHYASALAGAVIAWQDEHNIPYLVNTFGPNDANHVKASIAYFNSVHPLLYAEKNAATIKDNVKVRLIVGNQDWLYNNHGKYIIKNFSEKLDSLGIKNDYKVIDGVGHMLPDAISAGIVKYPIDFWVKAFDIYK